MNAAEPRNAGERPVSFTLDGRALIAPDRKQDAASILRLGGLDSAAYDLVRVRQGRAPEKPYDDAGQVVVHDGDTFLSVRQSAEVA